MIKINTMEAETLVDFIEINIFQIIREDTEIDNMNWLVNMVNIYLKCKEAVETSEKEK